jgi:hypothetical protein
VARSLVESGFELVATGGTHKELAKHDVPATKLAKLSEGRPNIADYIKNGQVQLILNTPTKKGPATDEGRIRSMAVLHKVPMITTLTGARAAAAAIRELQKGDWGVRPLQLAYDRSPVLRPVYLELAKTPEGMEFARKVFEKARKGYHPITETGIELVLYPEKKTS